MSIAPAATGYGIDGDGDNNLDHEQAPCIGHALATSLKEPSIEFVIEDTTASSFWHAVGADRLTRALTA